MTRNFARPLPSDKAIEVFLENCLGVHSSLKIRDGTDVPRSTIVRRLRDAEASVNTVVTMTTAESEDCRDEAYRTASARRKLRSDIFSELCSLPRLENDDLIRLGSGGAKPKDTEPIAAQNAYLVTGLPASGKSTLVNSIADCLKAMIVDSDYAKRKFPEFDSLAGAQIVHQESSMVVEGGCVNDDGEEEPSLLGFCKNLGLNFVMPKIGHDPKSILELRDALISSGYKVHLTTVILPRDVAARRALQRFIETNRYVPVARVFDTYANDPALNYYKFRVDDLKSKSKWESFGALCPKDGKYELLDISNDSNPAALFRSGI